MMAKRTVPVQPTGVIDEVMEHLPRGAFLTVKYGHRLNTMTIGWGTVGILWSRPVFMVAVRDSRYTFRLIEAARDYTVSVPLSDDFRRELAFCGTRSGKDVDKFKECGLEVRDATKVETPVLDIPGLHFECRTLLRTPMSPDLMDPSLLEMYPAKDYHTFYAGDILAAYRVG